MKVFLVFGLRLLWCLLCSSQSMAYHELAEVDPGSGSALHSRWKNWNGDLEAVRIELQEINRRSEEIEESLDRDLMKEDRAFLKWWFSRPESTSDQVFLHNLLSQSELHFAAKIARASLAIKTWRSADWVSELIPFPGTAEFIVEALTSPELMNDKGLNEYFLTKNPEFSRHLYRTYFRLFLPDPSSVNYGERIRDIIAAQLHAEYGPYFFLQYGGTEPHWIERQAQVVEFALRGIRSPSLMRDVVTKKLLQQPESALHPQWLEYVIRQSAAYSDFMDPELDRILGLPHWSQHPFLLRISQGELPRAESLRRAPWGLLGPGDCRRLLHRN